MNNSFEAVADSVGQSLNRSPSLRKNKAIGLTKPNLLDPNKLPQDDGKIAGVGTNYGLSPQLYQHKNQDHYANDLQNGYRDGRSISQMKAPTSGLSKAGLHAMSSQ